MQTKGFAGSLFDFTFRSLVTPRIIRFVYALTVLVIGLWFVALVLLAFAVSPAFGAAMLLVGGPLIALAGLIWTRMLLETAIVQFRILDGVGELIALGRLAVGGSSAGTAPAPDEAAAPGPVP